MIWFFERRRARLHYEIRRQTDGPNYELVITFPDGRQQVERYADPDDLAARSTRLEQSLTEEGWHPPNVGPRPAARSARPY
jgi:hypothetical protein